MSSRFFEFYDDHIFLSHEYQGVFKIKLDEDFTEISKVEKMPKIGKEVNSSLVKYNAGFPYIFFIP